MGSWWMIASPDFLRQTPRAPPCRGRPGQGRSRRSRARGQVRATLAAAVPMRHLLPFVGSFAVLEERVLLRGWRARLPRRASGVDQR